MSFLTDDLLFLFDVGRDDGRVCGCLCRISTDLCYGIVPAGERSKASTTPHILSISTVIRVIVVQVSTIEVSRFGRLTDV